MRKITYKGFEGEFGATYLDEKNLLANHDLLHIEVRDFDWDTSGMDEEEEDNDYEVPDLPDNCLMVFNQYGLWIGWYDENEELMFETNSYGWNIDQIKEEYLYMFKDTRWRRTELLEPSDIIDFLVESVVWKLTDAEVGFCVSGCSVEITWIGTDDIRDEKINDILL